MISLRSLGLERHYLDPPLTRRLVEIHDFSLNQKNPSSPLEDRHTNEFSRQKYLGQLIMAPSLVY